MQKQRTNKSKGPGSKSPALFDKSPKGVVKSAFVMRGNPVLAKDRVTETISLNNTPIVEEYARFLNQSDDLQNELLQVVVNSPTCDGIIKQKIELVLGAGLSAWRGKSGLFSAKQEPANDADLARLEAILLEVNADGESILDVLEKALTDYAHFGNCYVGFSKFQKRVYCYHIPFVKGKLKRRNQVGDVDTIGVCLDWKNWNSSQAEQYSAYPVFSPDKQGVERSVLHIAKYRPGMDYYGLPDYISGLLAATLEYYIDRRNISKMENANIPSGILQFFGANTVEEAEEVVNDAKKQFAGLGKNGGLLIQALADADLKAVFTAIENTEKEGEMLELQTVVAQKIITAHRWSTALAGIATAGKLGTNQQLIQEFETVQSTVIQPMQRLFLSKFLNEYLKLNGVNDLYLSIDNVTPTSFFGTINPETSLTADEKRQEMGFAPLPVLAADKYQEIREALNSFSPLVANKVLEVLERNELREMIGLEPNNNPNNDTDPSNGNN